MPKCPFCRLHTDTGSDLQDHIDVKHPDEATDLVGPRQQQRKRVKSKKKTPLIIDGDDVARADGPPKIQMIKKARISLIKLNYSPIIYVSTKLGKEIDNSTEYERLKNIKWIKETEDLVASMSKDASKKGCSILTNKPLGKQAKKLDTEDWKVKASIVNFDFDASQFVISP